MIRKTQAFYRQQCSGVASIEYALIAALIAIAIIGALTLAGTANGGIWDDWTSKAVAVFKSMGG